jgi:hypothetical protein
MDEYLAKPIRLDLLMAMLGRIGELRARRRAPLV